MKRIDHFAYIIREGGPRVIHFTRHFSWFAAEKHYGDLSRHYRGNPETDYSLAIYVGKAELERDLAEHYVIDYKARTLTSKTRK
jgi:hypothetical protein